MKLEKLLGSKTKVDILKYLVFKRQGVSMRALENELNWSFPAIKKQVESLEQAGVLNVDKNDSKGWSVTFDSSIKELVRKIFLFSLEQDVKSFLQAYPTSIKNYYMGKIFGYNIDIDMVIIHDGLERPLIEKIKSDLSEIFKSYFIDVVEIVFMTSSDFEKRQRLADKFVINLMRYGGNGK